MKHFHEYVQAVYKETGDEYDWFNKRMAQFQQAAAGQKGAIDPNTSPTPAAPAQQFQPTQQQAPAWTKEIPSRTLSQNEIQRLGLNPNHNLVWQGSTADAPPAYPYVYIKGKNLYKANPRYR